MELRQARFDETGFHESAFDEMATYSVKWRSTKCPEPCLSTLTLLVVFISSMWQKFRIQASLFVVLTKGWTEPPTPFSSAYTTVMKSMPISKIWNSFDSTGLRNALYCKFVPTFPKRKGLKNFISLVPSDCVCVLLKLDYMLVQFWGNLKGTFVIIAPSIALWWAK